MKSQQFTSKSRYLFVFVLLSALAQVCAGAQARGRRRVPSPAAESVVGIEVIDFENYTYTVNDRSYKLIGGYYASGAAPQAQWELRVFESPYYGDLTGDGKNEAIVVLSYGAVGGPHSVEARVYTLRNGRPALLANFPVADALRCDLDHYVDLDDGKVRIERVYGSAGNCDHNEISEYRWNGSRFMPVGEAKPTRCRCM
ncbi:MAG TPA: hypothetical protein VJ866_25265 [Pyrinomonadaceae bacterium]|nr:hypothetical protein [Pyrinomonadaceae bacterium]